MEKQMKNVFMIWLMICVCGCAMVLPRKQAYSVLPVELKQLEKYRAETYALISIPYPSGLNTLENGTAWELLIRLQNGKTEKTMATFMAYWDKKSDQLIFLMGEKNSGVLFALTKRTPADLIEAKGVLLSHDHNYCGHLTTGAADWCADEDEINWEKAAALSPLITAVKPESPEDARLWSAFEKAMKNPFIKGKNFALTPEYLQIIEKQSSRLWTIVRITATSVVAGTIVSFIATPIAGMASGALTASTQTMGETMVPPNINFPEYASGLTRRSEQTTLAKQLKQLEARLRAIEPKTSQK